MAQDFTEEVIFKNYSSGWQRELPVTLILWASGRADLHRQTGGGYDEAIAEGLKIAAERGWEKDPDMYEATMPTGVYIPLRRKAESEATQ